MRSIKKFALAAFAVMALSGCTKSSITTDAPVAAADGEEYVWTGNEVDPDKMDADDEYVEKVELVEENPVEETMFDWEQVEDEAIDLFNDTSYYPSSVEMDYVGDEDAKTIELTWILKDGTTEDEAMNYAAELVQKFNDILAVQTEDIAFADSDSFGGVWDQFALTVQISSEDGTMLIDKSYAAGDAIDLKLPEYTGEGPTVGETEERVSPGKK